MSERTCSLPDCDRRHCAKGYCRKHYYELAYVFPARPCRVSGCEWMTTNKTADGLCENHYRRLLRHGSTDARRFYPTRDMSPADALHLRSYPHGDCVLWSGFVDECGYGSVNATVWGGTTRVHRFSWMLVNGPIPDGAEIDHTCHNDDLSCAPARCLHRRCINPDHLELVSHDENMRRQTERLRLVRSLAAHAG